jgi:hypothetical protein
MANELDSPILRLTIANNVRLRHRKDSAIWECRWLRTCGILHSSRLCVIRERIAQIFSQGCNVKM